MYFRILQSTRAPTPPHPYHYRRDTAPPPLRGRWGEEEAAAEEGEGEAGVEVLVEERAHVPYYERQYYKERRRLRWGCGGTGERLRSGEAAVRRLGGRRWLVVGWEEEARWWWG